MTARETGVWTLDRLLAEELGPAAVWATPSVRARTEATLLFPHVDSLAGGVAAETRTLIAVGGGTLIDAAKLFRHHEAPHLFLVAIPSIWGSGAESSPVVVTEDNGRKSIRMDDAYRPDVRVVWPALADSIPPRMARNACGDVWAHALEGLLSPLANDEVRRDLAAVLHAIRELPVGPDARWFEPSAAACLLQARSSVGLVHGIAHTLEGPLRAAQPDRGWGHAALCATFLWPVMSLNVALSDHARTRLGEAGADEAGTLAVIRQLFDEEAYERAFPTLESRWTTILRDPCTRTNGALIRPQHLEYFRSRAFAA